MDVRGAVFRDDRILLVREASDGLWTLPGGWADVNQSAKECVERESLGGIRIPGAGGEARRGLGSAATGADAHPPLFDL